MNKMVTVVLTPVPNTQLHEEDHQLYTQYHIELDDSVSETQLADVALDVFHENVAVKVLDDFQISVLDKNQTALEPSDEYENGSGRAKGQIIDSTYPVSTLRKS